MVTTLSLGGQNGLDGDSLLCPFGGPGGHAVHGKQGPATGTIPCAPRVPSSNPYQTTVTFKVSAHPEVESRRHVFRRCSVHRPHSLRDKRMEVKCHSGRWSEFGRAWSVERWTRRSIF